jgi:hypothetical protein
VLGALLRQIEPQEQPGQRGTAQRQVHVERPAPAEVVRDEAPSEGTRDHRQCHDARHEALVAATLPRGNQVADDRHRADQQTAGAETLQRAESDELAHGL